MRRKEAWVRWTERWVPSLHQSLWWWLAIISVVALLGQEMARCSSFGMALAAAAEFEGFGEEMDEGEDDDAQLPLVVPPTVIRRSGPETDRGPPPPPTPLADPPVAFNDDKVKDHPVPPQAQTTRVRQEIWDEDEFEGFPVETATDPQAPSSVIKDSSSIKSNKQAQPAPEKWRRVPAGPQSYYVEAFSVLFIVAFALNYYFGRKENEKIALAWAAQFASKGSILEKNFSLLGTGEGEDAALLMKEGQNVFKFYASGRRYCQGLLATMDLQSRHDLISRLWYLISPKKDEITIDVYMNDDSMDPLVMAIARKKIAKAMQKEFKDLQQYATLLTASSNKRWPSDDLSVISESRDLATDILTEPVLDQVLGDKAFEKHGENFVSLHFSDHYPLGSHKKVLQFKYILPPANRMVEIVRLIAIVPYFIDIVGRFKLNAQARAKADAIRAKVAQEEFKESQNSRQQVLSKKKEDKKKVSDSDSRLTSEALRKKEEKDRLRLLKKSLPKVKMSRAHS
ncbi:hypothetical protein O6H91_09G033800 [Diphasiastrum complanatum]|uniref:Uncharacterized protein n=1 Tax=Diphasiastrum complanatum TaxID=34168 RepID=A0ACC2CN45_DIPCM|nr:hypothetical protein O6H91_09G033800 [Diphasiastrum complanatum]